MIKTHTILVLILIFIPGFIYAQSAITLNRQDLYGPKGTQLFMANDDLVSSAIGIGSAGENKTWDFRGLVNRYVDTVKIIAANVAPNRYSSKMPASDYVVYANQTYTFLKDNGTSLLGYGFGYIKNGIPLIEKYDSPVNIGFPILYTNSYSGVSYTTTLYKDPNLANGEDSVKITLKNQSTGTIDAWGTMILPDSSYNVLREKTVSELTESTYHKKNGSWILVETRQFNQLEYQWFAKGIGNVLVSMDVNPATQKINLVQFRTGKIIAGLNDESDYILNRLYPNPTSGEFTLHLNPNKNYNIEIFDIAGRKVFSRTPEKGTGILEISLNFCAKGFYQVIVSDDTGKKIQCEKLVVY